MQHGKGRIATNMYQSVICTLQWAATCPLLKVPLFWGGGKSGPHVYVVPWVHKGLSRNSII